MARLPTCSLLFAVCSFLLQQRVVISVRVGENEVAGAIANLLPCSDICVRCNKPGVAYMIVRNQTSSQLAGEVLRTGAVALATAYTPGLKEGVAAVSAWAPFVGEAFAEFLVKQGIGAAYGMALKTTEDSIQGRRILDGMSVACDEVVIVATAQGAYPPDENLADTYGHNKGAAQDFPIVSYHYIAPNKRQGDKDLVPVYDLWRYALDDITSKEMKKKGEGMMSRTGAWIASANPMERQDLPQIARELLNKQLCRDHDGLDHAWGGSHIESLGSGISRMFTSMITPSRDEEATADTQLANGVQHCLSAPPTYDWMDDPVNA